MENSNIAVKYDYSAAKLGLILVVFMTIFFAFLSHEQPAVQKPVISDLDKFSNYHKQLAAIEKPLDEADIDFQHQTKKAIENEDFYALYDSAKNLHDVTLQASYLLSQVDAPDLDNQDAQKTLNEVQENFNIYVNTLNDMSSNLMKVANKGYVSPKLASNIKDNHDMVQTSALNVAINIIKTYKALGVTDMDKVDIKNGGLITPDNTPDNTTTN